ncbi:MAG: hypothetical protein WD044_14935 [Dongiaceae bacterium]
MIVSYKHDYIFIKTVKVAGTSVEMALSCYCGPDDVITPVHPRDEIRRAPKMRRPQNFTLDPVLERDYADAINRRDFKSIWELFRELEKKSRFFNHMNALQIRSLVGEAFWHRAFKFTIDRNPYEVIVSKALWSIHDRDFNAVPDEAAIGQAIDDVIGWSVPNLDKYRIAGEVAVDRILRYENLRADLASIADRIGGDISTHLPGAKRKARKPEHTAARLLTPEQQQRIAERHAEAFDLLGYSRTLAPAD